MFASSKNQPIGLNNSQSFQAPALFRQPSFQPINYFQSPQYLQGFFKNYNHNIIQGSPFVNKNISQSINFVPRDQIRLPPIPLAALYMNKKITPHSFPPYIAGNKLPQTIVETLITEIPSFVEEPKNENIVKSDVIIEKNDIIQDLSKHPSISQTNENHSNKDSNEFKDEKFNLEQEKKNLEIKPFQNDQDSKINNHNEATNIKESKKEKRKKKKKTEFEFLSPT